MMRVVRGGILHATIPFRFSFRHALRARAEGDSVLVVLTDEEGRQGFGEGAPRDYVTGETSDGATRAIDEELAPRLLGRRYGSFEELRAALERAAADLPRDRHAAFCALELALLDLGGKVFDVCAGEVLGPVRKDAITYSGILSAEGEEATRATCARLVELGVTAVKVKVGRRQEEDEQVLSTARQVLGDEVSLRIDANCAWDAETALRRLEAFDRFRLEAVEQPCPADALDDLAEVVRSSEIPVIADESLCSLDDARRLIEAGACDLFNVRVSKCGGLLLCEKLRDLAGKAGIGCMLGAQVGETAILSAAGRHLGTRGPQLRFHEGSYGTLLLEQDVSDGTALGPRGTGRALDAPGLGIHVDLEPVSSHLREVRVLGAAA